MPSCNPPLGLFKLINNKGGKPLLILFLSLFVFVPFWGQKAHSKEPAPAKSLSLVTGISYTINKNRIDITIDTTSSPEIRYNKLRNPDRLYVDILDSALGKSLFGKRNIVVKNGFIKNIRYAQNRKDRVRIVINLNRFILYDVTKKETSVIIGARLLKSTNKKSKIKPKRGKKATVSKRDHDPYSLKNKIIVIDPGHGGKDPGALGSKGLREKNVVLDISLRLKKLLVRNLGVKVLLTRSTDVFIPIRQRTKIANKKKADLFISIHANADNDARSKGVETYYLSRTTSHKALVTAARENMTTLVDMEKTDLEFILADLKSTYKINESIILSNHVQKHFIGGLKKVYPGIKNLGVKKGPFYVLLGANMPSILVESFFMTNRIEEKKLKNKKFRQIIAKSIFNGIKKYLKETFVAYKTSNNPRSN